MPPSNSITVYCDSCKQPFKRQPSQIRKVKRQYCSRACWKHDLAEGRPPFLRLAANTVAESDDSCWVWQGQLSPTGYGQISVNGKTTQTHRFAYEQFYGTIDPDLMVCHHCDNPACVNPRHLFLGTAKDNAADMVAKGRNRPDRKPAKPRLKASDVVAIRRRFASGETDPVALAREYGVEPRAVAAAIRRRTFQHIEDY